jgi:hypothetical protein
VRARIRLPHCSLIDIAALMLPVWLAIIISHTTADADLWGHLRFGLDFLSGRGLPSADPYSFTSDVTWINHEWLSEALMGVAFVAGGAPGLNALKFAVIGGIAWIVWRTLTRVNDPTGSALVLTSLVLLTTYTRTQVLRPQLFSVLLFALTLDLLERSDVSWNRRWIGLPLVFCTWANCHGAWIVGYAALCVYVSVEAWEQRTVRAAGHAVALMLAVAAVTLVNPYGPAHWSFLRNTVGLSRTDISDWAPFIELPPAIIFIDTILPALAMVSAAACRRAPKPRHAAVIGLLAFATWRVGRVDAFLQIAIAILLGPTIVQALHVAGRSLDRFERLSTRSALHGLAATIVVLGACAAAARQMTHIAIEGPWIPDRDAIPFLQADARSARLLTWFDWGEYAIWHLSGAGIKVSMDGRRETVYSDRVLADHWALYRNARDAWQYPDRIGADQIWLPKRFPIVAVLQSHGWHVAFESDRSVVLSRAATTTLIASSRQTSPLFFPGE